MESDFKVPPEDVIHSGAEIHHIPRGGETTFHGPGQLVAYPILNLRRLGIGARAYVEGLEDAVIATLSRFSIDAQVGCHWDPPPPLLLPPSSANRVHGIAWGQLSHSMASRGWVLHEMAS